MQSLLYLLGLLSKELVKGQSHLLYTCTIGTVSAVAEVCMLDLQLDVSITTTIGCISPSIVYHFCTYISFQDVMQCRHSYTQGNVQGSNCCKTLENACLYVKFSITAFPTILYQHDWITLDCFSNNCKLVNLSLYNFVFLFPILLQWISIPDWSSTQLHPWGFVLFTNTEFCTEANF